MTVPVFVLTLTLTVYSNGVGRARRAGEVVGMALVATVIHGRA